MATVPDYSQQPTHWWRHLRFSLVPDLRIIVWLFSLSTRVVLLVILLGVLGFLATFAYFLVGRSWSMPTILSAGDERVVQQQRDWLERNLKLADLDTRIDVLQRQRLENANNIEIGRIGMESETNAVRVDLIQNDAEIKYLEDAIASATNEREKASYLLHRIGRLPDPENNYEKGLVNRARFLTDMLTRTDLSIKIAALDTTLGDDAARLAALKRKRDSLQAAQAIMAGKSGEQLSHQELEYVTIWNKDTFNVEAGTVEDQRLKTSLHKLKSLHDELSASLLPLSNSPLLAATRKPTAVVFVPYSNDARYVAGHRIYRCRLWLLFCSPIGRVEGPVDGEVALPHPLFRHLVRGRFYGLKLTAGQEAAQEWLLFATPPILF